MRTLVWSMLAGAALLLAACGGDSGASDAGDGSGRASDGGSGSAGASDKAGSTGGGSTASGKRLDGTVCRLLTVAEVEAAVKSGQTLVPTDIPGSKEEDRGCSYAFSGIPALVVSLLGERERLEASPLGAYRTAYPRSVVVPVRGAEALQLDPSGPSFIVHKNGLIAYVQPSAWPQSETTLSIATKLAQPIADRLP